MTDVAGEDVVVMIEIIPGILEQDFSKIETDINLVKPYVSWIEIDVLDHTLYPNDTYNKWTDFQKHTTQTNFAAHLMVADPAKYVYPLVQNGFKRLIADVGGYTIRDFLQTCRVHEIEVGIALDGPAPLELVEPYLHEVDCVLLMNIKAGFSGTPYLPQVLDKIKKVREMYPELPIQVDGGINPGTAKEVIAAGATRLISTSYLFWKNPHRIPEAIEEIKGA